MSIIEKAAKRLEEKRIREEQQQTELRANENLLDDIDAGAPPQEFDRNSSFGIAEKQAEAQTPDSAPSLDAEAPTVQSGEFHEDSIFNAPKDDSDSRSELHSPTEGTREYSGNEQAYNKEDTDDVNGEQNINGEVGDWAFDDIDNDSANTIMVTGLENGLYLSPDEGRSRTADEFRIIKRPLLVKAFAGAGGEHSHSNLIMVTSSVQSEGKSFVTLNLAISIAMEMDSTVLLVDADVARPGLSKRLHIIERPGLIEKLTDDRSEMQELLLRTDIPKLTVLPAGERHKRSTELLASQKMGELLDEMASRYSDRIVLFDSPPLLESTEASVLASQMGQVVVVVEAESTSQMLVKETLSQLDSLDNVSLVMNKCKENVFTRIFSGKYSGYAYGYGYGYGYGYEEEKSK